MLCPCSRGQKKKNIFIIFQSREHWAPLLQYKGGFTRCLPRFIYGPAQCFAPALLCKGILLAQPPKCEIQSLSGVCLCTSAAFHYLSTGSLLAHARKWTIQSLSEVCLCLCTSSAFRDLSNLSKLSKLSKRIPMAQLLPTACLHTLGPAVSRYAAQDCPCLQFHGPGKGAWFRLAKRSRHLGLPCFALRLGLWRWYQWLWCCQNFGMHFVSSFGPSTYHTARYTIQGCDCMSMQQLSRNNFWMLLPTFFRFLGPHFWVPFLGPIFGASYHFKRKFDWSQRL